MDKDIVNPSTRNPFALSPSTHNPFILSLSKGEHGSLRTGLSKGEHGSLRTGPSKVKHPFWRGKILPRLALMFAPFPRNTFCSIDVTSKCNLRCEHCYFFSYDQEGHKELTDGEWLQKIERMQTDKPFYSCTWVGGEPLLRSHLIEKGRRYFKANRVVTNGTLPLPDWPDVEFHISVDGTESLHDSIRGKGTYAKIKKNIGDCPHFGKGTVPFKVAIACCLHRGNSGCFEELLAEWRMVPNIRHILFDFFTPIKGVKEDLWLTFDERDRILEKLIVLKNEKYGDFIGGPPLTFKLMKSANKDKAVGKNCVFVKHGLALDVCGNVKKPCVIGPQADCSRCGCIVPYSIRAWKHPTNLLREIWSEIISR